MIRKKPKYQVVTVNVPSGTAAGTLIEGGILGGAGGGAQGVYRPDQDYQYIDGVAVNIAGALAGVTYVDVGLRDSSGMVHDNCHIEQWQANAAVDPNNKYKQLLIPCDGRSVYPRVVVPALTTGAFAIQFTFRLVDELEEIARV